MEERVRACRACRATIGWYALFCETCGAKQEPHGGAGSSDLPAESAPGPKAPGLEDEVRTHLAVPTGDARTVARDLFQTQLRLIHKNREAVESLLTEVSEVAKDLARAERAPRRDEARRLLDGLSARVYEAEQKWGELQVDYNRDSELIEEESREHMETADFDAYLSPDENAKIEAEFGLLRAQLESADSSLRDLGRNLARARQESESRYLSVAGSGGRQPWVLVAITLVLVGISAYSAFFVYQGDAVQLAACAGPLILAVGILLIAAFSRGRR